MIARLHPTGFQIKVGISLECQHIKEYHLVKELGKKSRTEWTNCTGAYILEIVTWPNCWETKLLTENSVMFMK